MKKIFYAAAAAFSAENLLFIFLRENWTALFLLAISAPIFLFFYFFNFYFLPKNREIWRVHFFVAIIFSAQFLYFFFEKFLRDEKIIDTFFDFFQIFLFIIFWRIFWKNKKIIFKNWKKK